MNKIISLSYFFQPNNEHAARNCIELANQFCTILKLMPICNTSNAGQKLPNLSF